MTAREPILDAASRVIAEMGARHMTLEAVAREAGVSKGGLLYHFPSKDELLTAMVERYVGRLAEAAPVSDAADGADLVRNLIRHRIAARSQKGDLRTAHGMLAAVAEHPSLVEPLRVYHDRLWARIKASGVDAERMLLPWFALEGLLFHEVINTSPLDAEERERVIGEILTLLSKATTC